MPAIEVKGTLPRAFRKTTYATIDRSEVLIETPISSTYICNLQPGVNKITIQLNFLLACRPNGAICYISPLHVGSITDKNSHPIEDFKLF